METRLLKLKGDFNNISNIRTNVKNIFDMLREKIDKLHQIYSDFIKNNKNDMFIFSLDSFHFQSKLINIEYDDMKRLFLAINNRMYCEYFKLHKIIIDYMIKNINDNKVNNFIKTNNYPIYKDLEPFKEYNFEFILEIHENILNLLSIIILNLNNKENELNIHIAKQNIGLNIDNFITTFNFNINIMREKIVLFITYIEFFHKMHTKYLKRFSNKIQLIYTHINNDIKFDDTIEVNKNKKQELIDELINNHIDKELLKDIKKSIGSETNSDKDSEDSKSSFNSNNILTIENLGASKNCILPLSNSFLELPKVEKKDYKNLFKKSVRKVSNILKFSSPKIDTFNNSKVNEDNIDNIFSDINNSCDSILDNNDNIGLNIYLLDSKDYKNEFITSNKENESQNLLNSFDLIKQDTSVEFILKDENSNFINNNNDNNNDNDNDNNNDNYNDKLN
jgi:hypothetical protein